MLNQKSNTPETNVLPEIEGLILTPELIDFIQNMQYCNNEELIYMRDTLAEAVCFLATSFYESSDREKISRLIADLAIIRDHLANLKAPENKQETGNWKGGF